MSTPHTRQGLALFLLAGCLAWPAAARETSDALVPTSREAQQRIAKAEAELATAKARIASLEAGLAEAKKQAGVSGKKDEDIAELKKKLAQAERDLREARAEKLALAKELAAEKAKPARVKEVVKEVTRPDPATEKALAEANKTIRALEVKLAGVGRASARPAEAAGLKPDVGLKADPRPALPPVQNIHGWRAEQVQALQKQTAAALGLPVTGKPCPDCPDEAVIPAGKFHMGTAKGEGGDDDERDSQGRSHEVTLAHPFAVTTTEVTQGLWKAVMGDIPNPSHFKDCGVDCPVDSVAWENKDGKKDDVKTFIERLNAKTGKSYRLLTEAEWEYACRAGGKHPYCGGDDVGKLAWYSGNSESKTHPVAQRDANAFGLFDMSGNVWEWVQDCWHDNYNNAPGDGHKAWQTENGGDGSRRVLRGGSWSSYPGVARSANRDWVGADLRYDGVGFRLARTLSP